MSRARSLAALLLGLVAATAGCMGADDEPAPAAAADDATATPGAAAPATGDAAGATSDEAAAPPAPVDTPYLHDGALANTVIVCEFTVTQGCQGTPSSATAGFDLAWSGNLTGFAPEMTWEAASPATERLAVHVFTCAPTAEGGTTCDALAAAEGSSPLLLDAGGLALAQGTQVRGFAYRPSELPSSPVPAFVHYELEQAFHVEGTLTTVSAT